MRVKFSYIKRSVNFNILHHPAFVLWTAIVFILNTFHCFLTESAPRAQATPRVLQVVGTQETPIGEKELQSLLC